MKKCRLFLLFVLAFLLCFSCGADPLEGHWSRSEDMAMEICDFQKGKVTLTAMVFIIPISIRGAYKVSKGQIVFNFTEGLNLDTGKWETLASEDLKKLGISANETVSYSIEGDVLTMDGDTYNRMSDEDYSEFEKELSN